MFRTNIFSSSGGYFCTRSMQYFTMNLWGVQPLTRRDWNILYVQIITTTTITTTKLMNQLIKCYGSLGFKDLSVIQCYVRDLVAYPITLLLSGDENIRCGVSSSVLRLLSIFIEIDPLVQSRNVGSHRQLAFFPF
jgi:hypothetical protein